VFLMDGFLDILTSCWDGGKITVYDWLNDDDIHLNKRQIQIVFVVRNFGTLICHFTSSSFHLLDRLLHTPREFDLYWTILCSLQTQGIIMTHIIKCGVKLITTRNRQVLSHNNKQIKKWEIYTIYNIIVVYINYIKYGGV
jgi:hypothetical protein